MCLNNGKDKNRVEEENYCLLSVGQESLYFLNALGGKAQFAYNESLVFSLQGALSLIGLNRAFQCVIEKHPILRAYFATDRLGNIYQAFDKETSFTAHIVEIEDPGMIATYLEAQIVLPFDFGCPTLMRASIVKRTATEFILVIVQHHIITDGLSSLIFLKDLAYFYNKIEQDKTIFIEEEPLRYAEWVKLEYKNYETIQYNDKLRTLTDRLRGYSGINFITTPRRQKEADEFSGDRFFFELNEALSVQLSAFSKEQGVTLFHVLFSAYTLFIYQYTRTNDLVIGVPFANREQKFFRETIGYFVNTLPLRINVDGDKNFVDFVKDIKIMALRYLGFQDVPLEHINSQLNRNTSVQQPLVQMLFAWSKNMSSLDFNLEGINIKQDRRYFSKTSKFPLSLFMLEEEKGNISGYFEYQDKLFDKPLVESFVTSFMALIKNIIDNPFEKISSVTMIDLYQRVQMRKDLFSHKLYGYKAKTLGECFSETAIKFPQKTGIIFNDCHYSYNTLEQHSNRWAVYIQAEYKRLYGSTMSPDTLIGLYVDRCEDMILGMLGILKAGAAYVPIDPNYPSDRVDYIIKDSQIKLLLTHRELSAISLDFDPDKIILMDENRVKESIEKCNAFPIYRANPEDLAYVLYTSGSTGRPKGVTVSHANVFFLFESLKKEYVFSSEDVWSLFHTFCFDISIWEIWGAFLFGGSLVIVPFNESRDPKIFYQLIKNKEVTVLTQTASAFQMLMNEDLLYCDKLSSLRYIAFVGESLKVSMLDPWVKKYGIDSPQLSNMYGITETTVYTNNKFITQSDIDLGRDNIGWPLEAFSMYILNEQMDWCPIGFVGEIYIGGKGVSRGYLRRETLTQERFMRDPHAKFLGLNEDSIIYKTGDLGRWMPDGSIEYLGRKDFQIKLRGFRIELNEIELAIESFPPILRAVVLLKGEGESAYLAAYYTLKQYYKFDLEALIAHIKLFLPEYMIPKTYSEQSHFPMTVNGKVDRGILHAIQDKLPLKTEIIVLSTETEKAIARIWSELLNVDLKKIGKNSIFFEMGGNSLLVIKMLNLISKMFLKECSLNKFMNVPTVEALANQIDSIEQDILLVDAFLSKLKEDIILDATIQANKSPNVSAYSPRSVLLTGATGFLGAHILVELLKDTTAKIYCLIRENSAIKAFEKIERKLSRYGFILAEHRDRIIPLLGDLDREKIGLSLEDFNLIIQEVDAIYHVGALVHHLFDYSTLYKTNVQSTLELIKIAATVKNKALHFVSTLGVECLDPLETIAVDDKARILQGLNFNGYLRSKWASEQLLKEAASRGIAAHIYRPGNIVAGKKGISEPETNHILLRLKGYLQLKKAYIHENEMLEMMPVDLLAEALLKVSSKPLKIIYNLNNSCGISWVEYLQSAKNLGFSFSFIHDLKEWNDILDSLDDKNAFYSLSIMYRKAQKGDDPSLSVSHIIPDYQIVTPSYPEMVKQQLRQLMDEGFLVPDSV